MSRSRQLALRPGLHEHACSCQGSNVAQMHKACFVHVQRPNVCPRQVICATMLTWIGKRSQSILLKEGLRMCRAELGGSSGAFQAVMQSVPDMYFARFFWFWWQTAIAALCMMIAWAIIYTQVSIKLYGHVQRIRLDRPIPQISLPFGEADSPV